MRKPSRRPSRPRPHRPTRTVRRLGRGASIGRGREGGRRRCFCIGRGGKQRRPAGGVCSCREAPRRNFSRDRKCQPSPSGSARGQPPLLWLEASKQLAAAEEASSQLQKGVQADAARFRKRPRSPGRPSTPQAPRLAARPRRRRGGRETTNDVEGALVDQAVDDFFDGDRVGRTRLRSPSGRGRKLAAFVDVGAYTPRGAIIPTKVWHALGLDASGVGRAADAAVQFK